MDKNYAYIGVNGKDHTSKVTAALGIAPTREWNVGDMRKCGSEYDFSHWEYRVAEFEQECMDEAVKKVIEFIEQNDLDFSKIPVGFQASICCAGFHERKGLGFHLSKEMVVSLGSIGLAVDFDLYCDAS